MANRDEKATAIPFVLVNAFTTSVFGGNPAAILLQDVPFEDTETYLQIARNLNQPMHCFLSPAERTKPENLLNPKAMAWRIRWFTARSEVPLCGHATLAASHALFSNLIQEGGQLVSEDVQVLKFETMHGGYFEARRLPPVLQEVEGSTLQRYEIAMPVFAPVPANPAEFEQARQAVCNAFGRPDLKVNYIGVAGEDAGEGAEIYMLIEVDEDMGKIDVDTSAFLSAPRVINVLTSHSRVPGISYETRMFAPKVGVPEDPVCGSANCIMAPYWATKLGFTIGNEKEMAALQVSKRGGRLWTELDWEKGRVLLRGAAKLMARGTIYL